MADDPDNLHNRLERHAGQPIAPIDPAFANRLESQLRIDHATATSPRPWAVRSVIPRLVAAGALVVAGVAGIVSLTADDAGVPVAVVDDEQSALLDEPVLDDGALPADVTVTPTPTPVDADGSNEAPAPPSALPTATTPPATTPPDGGSVEPTATPLVPTDPTPTSLPTQSTVPLPSATPSGVPTATPTTPPTATPTPMLIDSTTVPVPTATVLPEPSAAATPEPAATPTPTPEAEPAPIRLTCETRTTTDVVGVVCTWVEPAADRAVSWYQVLRSHNGGEAETVSRQRANAPTSYVDRSVVAGDEVTYLVQALDVDDQVVAASIRQIVQVP